MSVGRGLMQTGRIKVHPTTTSIFDISPINGVAQCGDLVTFTVHVDGYIAPDGYVIIQDAVDGYIVGYAALSPISGTTSSATITAVMVNSVGNYVAYYSYPYVLQTVTDKDASGQVLSSFGRSQSTINQYNVGFATTITTVTTLSAEAYFCYHYDFDVTASVTTTSLVPITDGYVLFRIFDNNTAIFDLDLAQVVAGVATGTIPADTLLPDGYFLQAMYLGEDCYASSASPAGAAGTAITPRSMDPTATSLPSLLGSNDRTGFIMLTATVSSTALSAPSIGTVSFTTTAPLAINLGTSYITDGVVPSTTVAPVTGGQPLPQFDIHVASTDGFASSGTFYISTDMGTQAITYTGIFGGVDPYFTGCFDTAPGAIIAIGGDVCAFAVAPGTFTSATVWTTRASYISDGYCYTSSTGSTTGFDIA